MWLSPGLMSWCLNWPNSVAGVELPPEPFYIAYQNSFVKPQTKCVLFIILTFYSSTHNAFLWWEYEYIKSYSKAICSKCNCTREWCKHYIWLWMTPKKDLLTNIIFQYPISLYIKFLNPKYMNKNMINNCGKLHYQWDDHLWEYHKWMHMSQILMKSFTMCWLHEMCSNWITGASWLPMFILAVGTRSTLENTTKSHFSHTVLYKQRTKAPLFFSCL